MKNTPKVEFGVYGISQYPRFPSKFEIRVKYQVYQAPQIS